MEEREQQPSICRLFEYLAYLERQDCTLPEKVQRIYRSVAALYAAGYPYYSITVAMIAREAGIGKGTVYEYFESKEDVLMKAYFYEVMQGLRALRESVEEKACFREQFTAIMEWLGNCSREAKSVGQILAGNGQVDLHSEKHSEKLLGSFRRFAAEYGYLRVLESVENTGQREGLLQVPANTMERYTAWSVLLMYVNYVNEPEQYDGMTAEEARDYCMQSFLKLLNPLPERG